MRVSLLLLPAALCLASQAAASSQVYLFEISAFNHARGCVQECATEYSNVGVNTFGCAAGGEVATCLCSNNVDQSSYMSSWYSSCALSKCSDEDDASTAVEIFADYCQANLDANTPLSVPATTTTAGFATSASMLPPAPCLDFPYFGLVVQRILLTLPRPWSFACRIDSNSNGKWRW